MVAVIRDYLVLFQLFAISNSIINGHKGLAHAQNCLKSAETVRDVQKCPEKQTEWEEAAQRKKCLEIRKYDNCTDVEYHCLVNEFRNKTIEVCTSPRRLHGYCPHYSSTGTDNTFAVRNDYTKECVEFSYPCNCSSGYLSTEAYKWQCCYNGTNRGIQINTGLDQNGFLGLWIFLGLGLPVIVYFGCVIYGIYCQKKPLCEALCLWRYISCKSLLCACSSSDPRKDEHESNSKLTGPNTRETIIDERETYNPNSRTSEVNDPKPEPIAPKAANSNSGASEVDGQEPKAIASHLKANLNSGVSQTSTATPNSNGKSVTDKKYPVSQTSDNDPGEEDLCLVAKYNAPFKAGNIMMTPIEEQALDKRVEGLEDLKKALEEKLYPICYGDDWYLDYKVKSTKQKMQNMERNSFGSAQMSFDQLKARLDSHCTKVGILEKSLKEMLQKTDEFIRDYGDFRNFITKPEQKKSAVNYDVEEKNNAVKSEKKLAAIKEINWTGEDSTNDTEHQKDYNTPAEEEEMPLLTKKAKSPVYVPPDYDNGASHVTENQSAKDRTMALIKDFENWRLVIRKDCCGIDNMEDTLLEIEGDTGILNMLFKPTEPINEEEGQQKENNVNNMEQTNEELNIMFDKLKVKYTR